MLSFKITRNGKFFYEGECGIVASKLINIMLEEAGDKNSPFFGNKFIFNTK